MDLESVAGDDLRIVIDALPMPAMLIGLDGEVLATNALARRWFAAGPGSRTFAELPVSYEIAELRSLVEDAKAGGRTISVADVAWSADGRELQLDLSVSPVPGADGAVRFLLLTALDRSDLLAQRSRYEELRTEHADLRARRETATEELQELNQDLEATNEQLRHRVRDLAAAEEADIRKNQFLAMLAHELRNPLGAALNALHIIRRLSVANRQINQAVRVAERQLRHEARLLDDLLDVSRIVLGKVTVQSAPTDLAGSVRTAVEGADHASKARALEVEIDLPDHPLAVMADATRLEQCIGNLLSNAVKFTPPGGKIRISARLDGAQAVITVTDSGVGIPADMLGRVFDLFTQGDSSLARVQGGLGVGLTLVRQLVELQGGSVVARSDGPGRGSEFEIRLALAESPPVTPTLEADGPVRPRRILIVDDNRDAREMLRTVMQLHGHSVLETGEGVGAVRIAVEAVPDVVVLDIGLPDVDGFEVARRIRNRRGDSVRLIGLSGYGDDEARHAGREAGFDAHLVKPVSPEMLLRILDSV